ncbi:glycosyltransferase [Streptomyces sp. NPDC020141]|uniref:glycosyltransferase n=1 Tax=Streptomyces sp. NPDC020141 TaxID=3365065 RepID=UPI0037AA1F70
MRALFTTIGSPSHGRAQLPLVRALAAAGHEVRVATTRPIAPVFENDDVDVATCIDDIEPGSHVMRHLEEIARNPDLSEEQQREGLKRAMSESLADGMARDLLGALLPVVRDFRPDVILRDGMDLSSVLMGEMLGIPQLPTPSGASNSLDPADMLPGLNALRRENGLPERADPLSIVPQGRIDYVPAAFSFASHMPVSRAYRQAVAVDRASVLPRWVAELPTDRPLVFAALGTALPIIRAKQREKDAPEMPFKIADPVETLRAIVRAASLLDECTVVVSTSGIPTEIDGLPPHVHITEHLPQPLLLESVDLLLTHGGFNSIREALRTATPLAVVPHFGDQFDNARRVEELGIGREITDVTPDGIAAVCRAVLADATAAARTRRARLAMLALPEIDSAVADLEQLAG